MVIEVAVMLSISTPRDRISSRRDRAFGKYFPVFCVETRALIRVL
jgi:hypothetical protein